MHKGTEDLHQYLRDTLPITVYNEELKNCFFANGNPSSKRMKRLFDDNGRDDIRHCTAKEVLALADLLNLDPWHLIKEYGMGELAINLKEGNSILQLQGDTLGRVQHVA